MTYSPSVSHVRFPQHQLLVPADALATAQTVAAAAGTANQAYYQPFTVPYTTTLLAMAFAVNTGTNNHDLGIYQDTTRLTSRGPTASVASSVNSWTLSTPLVLQEGILYYAAFATAGTKQVVKAFGSSIFNPRYGRMIQTGLTAATLPATATFAAPAADALCPIIRLTFSY